MRRLAVAAAFVLLAPLWLCVVAGQVVAIWSGSLSPDAPEVYRTSRYLAGNCAVVRRRKLTRRARGGTSAEPL